MPEKLGQNFLKNKKIVDDIIKAADLKSDDFVLEIGPGKGVLTEELAKKAGKVVAIELDKNLVEILKNKFKDSKNVEIVNEDILKINLIDLISLINPNKSQTPNTKYEIQNTEYKVIANLPYYITSPIIRKFLETETRPVEMILMVQKEVAQRIVANPGQHSILSLSVQYYAKPEILFFVDKENFDPVPEVDSAVIRISANSKQQTANRKEIEIFFRIVKAGFCAKRKTLANNLSNSFHLDKKEVEEKLKSLGISEKARAQELDLRAWKELAEKF
jgi:16S rRNA (adenine1518-N6/adenine1519-N6)-dimethyltransferase